MKSFLFMVDGDIGDATSSHHAHIDTQHHKVHHKHERKAVKKHNIIPAYTIAQYRAVVVIVHHTRIAVIAVVGALLLGRCPAVGTLQNPCHFFDFLFRFFCVPGVNKTY